MSESKDGQLTEVQKRFAERYIATGNASASAREAGFSRNYGSKLLKKPGVRAYLESRRLEKDRVASADEVLAYLTDVLRGGGAAESRGGAPRMKAAELLGRRLGIFAEPSEAEGPPPVIIDDVGPGRCASAGQEDDHAQ